MSYSYYFRGIMHKTMQYMDSALEPFGITNQQARLVSLINWHKGKKVFQKDLEKLTGLTGPSVTSLLNGLEKRGYVTRVISKADSRAKELYVEPKGNDLVHTFHTIFSVTDEIITNDMSDEEKALFMTLLQKAAANVGVEPPPPEYQKQDE